MNAPASASVHDITLDDIRHKALAIREEIRDEVREQVTERRDQALVVGAVVVLAVIGIAYFAGSRACRRDVEPPRS